LWEHQHKINPNSFSARYNLFIPVYYKGFETIEEAIEKELYIKGKTRKWKDNLIASMNPNWFDLSKEIINMKP
jgi:putative endonuclease